MDKRRKKPLARSTTRERFLTPRSKLVKPGGHKAVLHQVGRRLCQQHFNREQGFQSAGDFAVYVKEFVGDVMEKCRTDGSRPSSAGWPQCEQYSPCSTSSQFRRVSRAHYFTR